MNIRNYFNKNRANDILAIGIASMQADMAARSSIVRAVETCMALYPAHGIQSRFLRRTRVRIGCLAAVIATVIAHEKWQNEPISGRFPITQAPANSPVRLWLMADTQIKVTSDIASWWKNTISNSSQFSLVPQTEKNGTPSQAHSAAGFNESLKQATEFVKENHSFYSTITALLSNKWITLKPGMVVTLSHNETPWLINNAMGLDYIKHCNQVDTAEGSSVEKNKWWFKTSNSYRTQLTPQDIVNGALPVIADALHIRTWQSQAVNHTDRAANDAVEEVKLGVDAIDVDAPSNHSHFEAYMIVLTGLNDLQDMAGHVSVKQALKTVQSLDELSRSIPDIKQLIKDDIRFNRGRLVFYLSRNPITLQTIADAVNHQTDYETGTQKSPDILNYFGNLAGQLIALNKSRILRDYDRQSEQDYKFRANSNGFYFISSTNTGNDEEDSIAWNAFMPGTDMSVSPLIEKLLTKIGMVKIEYGLQIYSAVHGKLPSSLSQLVPTYLVSLPTNLEMPSNENLSKFIVHKSIIYKRYGNSYILYTLPSQLKISNSGDMVTSPQITSQTHPDGTPSASYLHYRGYSAISGAPR